MAWTRNFTEGGGGYPLYHSLYIWTPLKVIWWTSPKEVRSSCYAHPLCPCRWSGRRRSMTLNFFSEFQVICCRSKKKFVGLKTTGPYLLKSVISAFFKNDKAQVLVKGMYKNNLPFKARSFAFNGAPSFVIFAITIPFTAYVFSRIKSVFKTITPSSTGKRKVPYLNTFSDWLLSDLDIVVIIRLCGICTSDSSKIEKTYSTAM